jgi:hypothetical protein
VIQLSPGPAATVADLRRVQARQELLRSELGRVRAAAAAWRTGLAGLLVALTGFSLVKGRAEVGELAYGWSVAVGILLAAAIVTGVCAALAILRAAHGRPRIADVSRLPPAVVLDHDEALASARALRAGIVLALLCGALLVTAVATTWYGPPAAGASVKVTTPAGVTCGSSLRVDGQSLIVRTGDGEIRLPLSSVSNVSATKTCP